MTKFEVPKEAAGLSPDNVAPLGDGWIMMGGSYVDDAWVEYVIEIKTSGIVSCKPGFFLWDKQDNRPVIKSKRSDHRRLTPRAHDFVHLDATGRYFAMARYGGDLLRSNSLKNDYLSQSEGFHLFGRILMRQHTGVCVGDTSLLRAACIAIPDAHAACINADGQTVLAVDRDFTTVTIFDNPLL